MGDEVEVEGRPLGPGQGLALPRAVVGGDVGQQPAVGVEEGVGDPDEQVAAGPVRAGQPGVDVLLRKRRRRLPLLELQRARLARG